MYYYWWQPLACKGVCATEAESRGGQVRSTSGSSGCGPGSSGSLGLDPALPYFALSSALGTSSGPALALSCGRR